VTVYGAPFRGCATDSWHATFLGRRHLPREVTAFEIEVFFQFSAEEVWIIEERLLGFARSCLYEHRLIIVHERLLRSMIAVARRAHEAQLARRIDHAVELDPRVRVSLSVRQGWVTSRGLHNDESTPV
jgi:hypothetical protein